MPTADVPEFRNLSPLIRRFERALLEKGCSPRKAAAVAYRKAVRHANRHGL